MSFLSTLRRLGKLGTTGAGIRELCVAHAKERLTGAAAWRDEHADDPKREAGANHVRPGRGFQGAATVPTSHGSVKANELASSGSAVHQREGLPASVSDDQDGTRRAGAGPASAHLSHLLAATELKGEPHLATASTPEPGAAGSDKLKGETK